MSLFSLADYSSDLFDGESLSGFLFEHLLRAWSVGEECFALCFEVEQLFESYEVIEQSDELAYLLVIHFQ